VGSGGAGKSNHRTGNDAFAAEPAREVARFVQALGQRDRVGQAHRFETASALAAAIKWEAQQFQTRTAILCHCDHALEEVNLTPDRSTAIFRIFQDALANVLSHSKAGIVSVIIEEDSREFKLRISDNGITYDEKSSRLSLGMFGMRERAQLVDGTIDITRSSATGTTVIVRIPTSQPAVD